MVAPLLLVNTTLLGAPIKAEFVADKDCGTSTALGLNTIEAEVTGTAGCDTLLSVLAGATGAAAGNNPWTIGAL